jgi:hypothetical protein
MDTLDIDSFAAEQNQPALSSVPAKKVTSETQMTEAEIAELIGTTLG